MTQRLLHAAALVAGVLCLAPPAYGVPIPADTKGDVIADRAGFIPNRKHLALPGKIVAVLATDAQPVLSTGATAVRVASLRVLAVSRIDLSARREYLVLANSGATTARVTFRTATPRSEWTRLLGSPPAFSSSANGTVTVSLAPFSSALLEATRQIPVTRPAKPQVSAGPDSISEFARVSATTTAAPVTVGFALRRAGARTWTRLSSDDSPPYRTFLDPTRFKRRETVYLVAVARGLGGGTAVSAVRSFVPRR